MDPTTAKAAWRTGRPTAPMTVAVLLAGMGACRSANAPVEPGAVVVHVTLAPAVPAPDELRVWAWDDNGELWDDVSVPVSASSKSASGSDIGTIVIRPGSIDGPLRVHVQAVAQGSRVGDGLVIISSLDGSRTFEVRVDRAIIDDCPLVPDPVRCPRPGSPDAASMPLDARPAAGPAFDAIPSEVTDARPPTISGGATGSGGEGDDPGEGGQSGNDADDPNPGAGGMMGPGGAGGETSSGTGGAAAMGGATSTSGGSGAFGGTPDPRGSGGMTGNGGFTGSGGIGSGGVVASGGVNGSGGTTARVTAPPPSLLPGTACTSESSGGTCRTPGSICYKHCGPAQQGYKTESCTSGKYLESACTFSATTRYGCYALGSVSACAATPPVAGSPCFIDDCKPCGSATSTAYYDGTKAAKVGYCVCSAGQWSCASTSAWPCPGRPGC